MQTNSKNETSRVVLVKDEKTEKITLVDESIVTHEAPTKTVIKTTEGTKKITTNDI